MRSVYGAPMVIEAAIFDLDRTLLAGASGPVLSRALRRAGLLPARPLPGEDLAFAVFDWVGETWPSMLLTRQGARLAEGWDVERLQVAGQLAAPELIAAVLPWGRVLIDEHHAAGRPVVLATTSPDDLVAPLADALGIDAVVATRYGHRDGRCDGTIDGEFVWGRGKHRAVQAWADAHDVELAGSWAYSDSWFDLPLLRGVGHPIAVNPDLRLRLWATAQRWPVQFFDVPPGVPKVLRIEPQQALMPFFRPELTCFARVEVEGTEGLPGAGPAIVCANHRSYFDPFAIGFAAARRGRPVRFLAKREVFDAPVVGDVARAMGAIRVDRRGGGDEAVAEAQAALAAGELVVILPEGTIPRGEAAADPVLRGRWGAARLAAATGAPVIPIGLAGTEHVWPRSSPVPRVWDVVRPPAVRVRVGEPVALGLDDPAADTERIMASISALIP